MRPPSLVVLATPPATLPAAEMLLARLIHVLGFIALVGGQLTLIFAVVPAEHKFAGSREVMVSIGRRYGVIFGVALVALLASGAYMAGELQLWSSNLLHVKLMFVVLIVILVALHQLSERVRAFAWVNFLVSLLVVWLGLKLTYAG